MAYFGKKFGSVLTCIKSDYIPYEKASRTFVLNGDNIALKGAKKLEFWETAKKMFKKKKKSL